MMKPIDMQVLHNPEKGEYGDCQRACIASLLELSVNEVPHFHEDNNTSSFYRKLNSFLGDRGLLHLSFGIGANGTFWDYVTMPDPVDCYHMIYGETERGTHHAVVALNGEIVHDPHPSKAGLLESEKDDWTYAFLVKAQ